MELFGKIFAWLAVIMLVIFCIKPVLRKIKNKSKFKIFLIKNHTIMGVLFIVFTVLHIVLSNSTNVNVMFGKISLILIVFSLITLLFKKKLKNKYIVIHGMFAILALLFAVLHIFQSNL